MPQFKLRYPTVLAADAGLIDIDRAPPTLGGRQLELVASGSLFDLVIQPFATGADALEFVPKLAAALYWTAVRHRCAYRNSIPASAVLVENDSSALEGRRISSADAVVSQLDAEVSMALAIEGTVSARFDCREFIATLERGLAVVAPSALQDEKLRIALSLYGASFRSETEGARLLQRVMALESVAPDAVRPEKIRSVVDEWKEQARARRDGCGTDSDDWNAWNALLGDVMFKDRESITMRIRGLVHGSAAALGVKNPEQLASNAVKAYGVRGKLTHVGRVSSTELSKASNDAFHALEVVLLSQLQSGAPRAP
ncbi:MAG: hypothetical protein ACKVWV_11415 [Planctomycetota bacterium]